MYVDDEATTQPLLHRFIFRKTYLFAVNVNSVRMSGEGEERGGFGRGRGGRGRGGRGGRGGGRGERRGGDREENQWVPVTKLGKFTLKFTAKRCRH
jgi:hypothetical protein